jgi:MFS family permease
MGMLGLALVLSVRHATGSFAWAGFASGAFALTAGVLAPIRGRVVDRIGRRGGVRVLGAGYTLAGAILLVFIATVRAPIPLIIAAAALGASAPPISAVTRTAWPEVVGRGPHLSTALALDTVTEEVFSLTGPVLTGVLAATTSPGVALATTVALELIAVLLFILWAPGAQETRAEGDTTRPSGVQGPLQVLLSIAPVLIPLLTVGIGLGIIDVAVPALALHRGSATTAGWMLAALSAGSSLGGLAYGRRAWRSSPIIRYRWLCLAVVACFAPLPLITGWVHSWPLLLFAGLPIAPTLITGYLLADESTPEGGKTEAATWISTAQNSGVAAGAAVAGALITTLPLTPIFAIPALATLAGLTITMASHTARRRDRAQTANQPAEQR